MSLGEGSVRVLWTPSATLWLHRDGEATIDASDAGSNGHWLLAPELKELSNNALCVLSYVPELPNLDQEQAIASSIFKL